MEHLLSYPLALSFCVELHENLSGSGRSDHKPVSFSAYRGRCLDGEADHKAMEDQPKTFELHERQVMKILPTASPALMAHSKGILPS